MAATAQILIEVDDSGAVSALNAVGSAGAKIGPSLAPAGPALDKLTTSTKQSREAAALLSEELGVNIPRGLRSILAENSVIGPAISAAFSGLAVVGFVEIVKQGLDQLTGFTEQLGVIKKQNDDILSSTAQANKILQGPLNLSQVNAQILSTTQRIEKLNEVLSLTGNAPIDALLRGLTKYSSLGAALIDELDKEKTKLDQLNVSQAQLNDEQKRTDVIEILKQQNVAREAGLRGIAAIRAADRDYANEVRLSIADNVTRDAVGQAEIVAHHKQALAQIKEFEYQHLQASIQTTVQNQLAISNADAATSHGIEQIYKQRDAQIQAINASENAANAALEHDGLARTADFQDQRVAAAKVADFKILEFHQQVANEMAQADSEAAVAMAAPWERSYIQIQEDYKSSLNKIAQDRAKGLLDDGQAADLAADAWKVSFAKTRDQLANDMETFFDDLTSGKIGQAFKKKFEDLVFQMVATWILGMNSMRAAASTGFGGGGGGSQGGIGGLPAVITNLFGGGSAAGGVMAGAPASNIGDVLVPMLGLSAGMGATPGGAMPAGASTGAAAAGLGGLLAKIFPHGLSIGGAKVSGAALAELGAMAGVFGESSILKGGTLNTILGIGSDALSGASIGFSVGGPLGAGIGALIGLGVGAITAIFKAIFGTHTGDTARIQVMEPLLSAIKTITNSYDVFQTDYNTGISELETLRTNSLAALKKIGGHQVSGNSAGTNQRIDAAEKHLQDTEAERQRRAQLTFGPPQFHEGGFVRGGLAAIYGRPEFHGGGEVNANLLIGEGVLNRRAMGLLGESGLNRMNAGGGGGDTHNHFYISAIDAKSFDAYLAGGGMQAIAKASRRASREGMRI